MWSTAWQALDQETDHGLLSSFEVESRCGRATVHVSGEVDIATEPTFRQALDTVIAEARSPAVIDLSRVTFMDARGLSPLINARQAVAGTDVTLVLLDPAPPVRRLLEVTGLEQYFDIELSEVEQP